MMSDLLGWILPYRRSEICFDLDSQLRIEHIVQPTPVVRRIPLTARSSATASRTQG